MAGDPNQGNYWQQNPDFQQQAYGNVNFEIPVQPDFGQDLSFQSFDSNSATTAYTDQTGYGNNPYLNAAGGNFGGGVFLPAGTPGAQKFDSVGNEFEDEPPLLEELGINLEYILQKTLTVLNPFRTPEVAAMQDTDFAGPLTFCLMFGALLLLSGKVHFSYIYGIGVFGCLSVWALLSLMSSTQVSLGTVVTVLGYCILPMVALSGINVILSLQGYIGIVLTSLAIMWCSLSASKLFVTALSMDHQQPLVVYPCALLYGVFALITVF